MGCLYATQIQNSSLSFIVILFDYNIFNQTYPSCCTIVFRFWYGNFISSVFKCWLLLHHTDRGYRLVLPKDCKFSSLSHGMIEPRTAQALECFDRKCQHLTWLYVVWCYLNQIENKWNASMCTLVPLTVPRWQMLMADLSLLRWWHCG